MMRMAFDLPTECVTRLILLAHDAQRDWQWLAEKLLCDAVYTAWLESPRGLPERLDLQVPE